ncbi:hypothetical protein FO519_001176 [Halicephalobus sp. NKZ332]|nr:hypothetical protein FO519_001176 [Halicephalobus sp. NKZ332]
MDNSVGVPATDQRPVPSVIDLVLPVEGLHVNIIKFNRLGTLIAAGAVNGYLAMIDFTTKRTSNIWNAHVLGVTSISWSRDGRQIFSTALDNTYVISDVASGTVIEHILVGQGLISALLNPRNSNHVLFNTNVGIKLTNMKEKSNQKLEGSILTYDLTGKVVSSGSIDSPQTIRSMFATRRLGLILVVSADRYIRVYEFTELLKKDKEVFETENRLCDPSNRTVWQSVCASGEADYVAGMSATSHMITIFERVTGTIVATLCESKKEIPLSFDWHPTKPAVSSVCNGQIFIWKQKPKPSWAAYAPHFSELGENMFYKEKESEFDQLDEDIPKDDSSTKRSSEMFIDIESTKAPSPLCSSDDEDPNRLGTSLAAVNATLAERPRSSKPRFPLSMVMNPDAAYDTSINLAPLIEHQRISSSQGELVRHENGESVTNGYISPVNGKEEQPHDPEFQSGSKSKYSEHQEEPRYPDSEQQSGSRPRYPDPRDKSRSRSTTSSDSSDSGPRRKRRRAKSSSSSSSAVSHKWDSP